MELLSTTALFSSMDNAAGHATMGHPTVGHTTMGGDTRVVAIIATLPSREEVLRRAIGSVQAQLRKPDALVVVVDLAQQATDRARTLEELHAEANAYVALLSAELGGIGILVMKNERTANVSGTGCWNTGIMRALALDMEHTEYVGSTCKTFVAILDDDDEWEPQHVQICLEAGTAADWIVSGLIRDIGKRRSNEMATLDTLCVSEFLRGNPGVQGSNLFLRLSLVLRAGMFDESMNSMTDRDLCIRILDTLGATAATRVAFTGVCTVVHHADPIDIRPRVTTDKPAKEIAINKFLWRYAHRFSKDDFDAFCSRMRSKFQIDVQPPPKEASARSNITTLPTMSGDLVDLPQHALRHLCRGLFHLTPVPESHKTLQGLFGIISSDTRRLRPLLKDIASMPKHIYASVIMFANTADPQRLEDLQDCAREVASITVKVITVQDEDVECIVHDYASACGLSAPPVPAFDIGIARTVLQLCMHKVLLERETIEFAMVLDDDKRLPKDSFLSAGYVFSLDRKSIFIGQDCKTAPNTLANGLRTQLRDLVFAQERGLPCNVNAPLYYPTADGTVCEVEPHDAYYDLSTSRFDHLEEPQLFPASQKNVRDRVLRGDPLARVALPQAVQGPTRQRGGCMLIFRENFGILTCPQVLPEIVLDGARVLSRRSDSVWLATQAQNISCTVLPGLFVLHENHYDAIPSPKKFRCNALKETFGSILCRRNEDRDSYTRRRICAMLSNNERIRGLTDIIRRNSDKDLLRLAEDLDALFDEAAWRCEVFQPLSANNLLIQNWSAISCINKWTATNYLREERGIAQLDEFVGAGSEGVVFRHASRAFKVFVGEFPENSIELLRVKGILDCKREGTKGISYSFVRGEEYRGGHGKKLVEMLRRLKDLSVVMTNIKPDNLVVADGTLEIVDLGRDWVKYDSALWKSMCRRAFLSWRFGNHCRSPEGAQHLKLLMQRERTEPFFSELTGFETFFQVCEHGFSPFIDPDRFDKVHVAALMPIPRRLSSHDTSCTLVIKTCLMEAKTILANVRRLVWTMRRSGTVFEEIVLSVDRNKHNMLRQYAAIDERAFDEALESIKEEKLIGRVHNNLFDCSASSSVHGAVKDLNRKYFGIENSLATHSESGESHASLFSTLEIVETALVLQVDSDICINMHAPEDLVTRAASIFELDPLGVTALALPIYCKAPQAGIDGFVYPNETQRPYRFEIRFSFIHLSRFRSMLPLLVPAEHRSEKPEHVLKDVGWYRIFDTHIQKAGLRSYRVFSPSGFWLHPTNDCKRSSEEYMLLADRIGSADVVRRLPCPGLLMPSQEAWAAQDSLVDIHSSGIEAYFGERAEKLVFVCCGRNISYGRALRCLESLYNQRGANSAQVGVIVVDDASVECPDALFEASRHLFPGRVTNIHTGIHLGGLQNKNHAIKRVCTNPESIVVTLDLDDFLFKQPEAEPSVVERIRDCFFGTHWVHPTRYLVALGGMVRATKLKDYPLHGLECLRHTAAAGNVWKHIRCFKKHLFDAIPEEHFCIGGEWIPHGTDWAFMVPVVEQAGPDRVFEFPSHLSLYFYEDLSSRYARDRDLKHSTLDSVAAFLKSLSPYPRFVEAPCSAPALLTKCALPSDQVGDRVPQLYTYEKNSTNGSQVRVLVVGNVRNAENVPVRIHSECFSGDVLGSMRCDCGPQKNHFLKMMGAKDCECAVLVYICGHEGRGNGWDNKAREYALADLHPELNHDEIMCSLPGCVSDCRDYSEAAVIVYSLGMRSVCLHTNNPNKVAALEQKFDRALLSVEPVPADMTNPYSLKYLLEKVDLLKHDIRLTVPSLELLSLEVRNMLEKIPFQNLSLLTGLKNTAPDDLGLCFDRNVNLLGQLKKRGFQQARVIGARTRFFCESEESRLNREQGIPLAFNHIILIVNIAGQDYLVDVGNGYPYFTPLALPKEVDSSIICEFPPFRTNGTPSFLKYRVRMISDTPATFVMDHNRPRERADWKVNFTFCPEDSLSDDGVDEIVTAHAKEVNFGHMLHSLRISTWSLCGTTSSVILRDSSACIVQPSGEKKCIEIHTGDELAAFVQQHFGESMCSKLEKAAPALLDNVKMKTTPPLEFVHLLESYVKLTKEGRDVNTDGSSSTSDWRLQHEAKKSVGEAMTPVISFMVETAAAQATPISPTTQLQTSAVGAANGV